MSMRLLLVHVVNLESFPNTSEPQIFKGIFRILFGTTHGDFKRDIRIPNNIKVSKEHSDLRPGVNNMLRTCKILINYNKA